MHNINKLLLLLFGIVSVFMYFQLSNDLFDVLVPKISHIIISIKGIKNDTELLKTRLSMVTSITTVKKDSELELFAKKTNIRVEYSQRNPKLIDLLKLKGKLFDLEPSSDPLTTSAKCVDKTFLTVLVLSSPNNYERRKLIRESWGSTYTKDIELLKGAKPFKNNEKSIQPKSMFQTVFVIGKSDNDAEMKKVHEEANQHKDIVFGSLHEDYKNLTMKTRLGLKWAYYNCDSTYVLKTDDDVFINPVKLTEWLKEMPRENFYTGWCNFGSVVVRNPNSKWYVSYEDFPDKRYPGYCLGGGYLMSNDVLGKIMSISYERKLFPMEDVYVGLMVRELSEVKIQDEKQHFNLVYNGNTHGCDFNNLFLAHQVKGKNLLKSLEMARKAIMSCS